MRLSPPNDEQLLFTNHRCIEASCGTPKASTRFVKGTLGCGESCSPLLGASPVDGVKHTLHQVRQRGKTNLFVNLTRWATQDLFKSWMSYSSLGHL